MLGMSAGAADRRSLRWCHSFNSSWRTRPARRRQLAVRLDRARSAQSSAAIIRTGSTLYPPSRSSLVDGGRGRRRRRRQKKAAESHKSPVLFSRKRERETTRRSGLVEKARWCSKEKECARRRKKREAEKEARRMSPGAPMSKEREGAALSFVRGSGRRCGACGPTRRGDGSASAREDAEEDLG